ncbi:MAG: Rieske (2Fe-2S) protein [Anaerolineae bacterium]|jgi:menaquinol-cytochrome c reductase iron-sulfur subunit
MIEIDREKLRRKDEEELPLPLPFPITRRQFFITLSLGLGGLAAAVASIPIIGSLFAPFINQSPEVWRPVGKVDDFEVGHTTQVSFRNKAPLPWTGVAAETAAWLRRDAEQQFTAFAINCTHLGCPVRWLSDAELFMCPCHGGVYYSDGKVAAGPPPLPLPQYPVRINGGVVEIRTSPVPFTPWGAG